MNLRLAITKVGDLLASGKITTDKDGNEIRGVNLSVPIYQRPYKWSAANATQLLDDILEAMTANKAIYRVGTLILHENQLQYDIVDGQQRTITFALLFKAFCDLHPEMSFLNVNLLGQKVDVSSNTRKNIRGNYSALLRRLQGIPRETHKELFDYISNNCELVVVITDDLSEAFQFFDSQNARGKPLYPHDLLKAYHLREMGDLPQETIENTVAQWESMNQMELSRLFSDYLYCIKEWIKGDWAYGLTERNIRKFKGIRKSDDFPYAQFYKGAYAYAESINSSKLPFVAGMQNLKSFQIDSPIISGKPFFEYAKHYFEILSDVRNNDKYSGYYINDNKIVKTLDAYYSTGVGNCIVRLLFDSALLLYIDRFCPGRPSQQDSMMLDRFVIQAFAWAYSLRAQYYNLGWQSAQNYILGRTGLINSFNMFKLIAESTSPIELFAALAEEIKPLSDGNVKRHKPWIRQPLDENDTVRDYLDHFQEYKLVTISKELKR